jgi:ubiquitin-like protein Pup
MASEQERKKQRIAEPAPEDQAQEASPNPATLEKGKKLKEDIDRLLDEIDEVLEENAEEFVRSYVQQGGE